MPTYPRCIYRKNNAIQEKLVKNFTDPPKKIKMFGNLDGFFRCNKCKACNSTKKEGTSFTDNKNYKIKSLITCDSTHVVHVLECSC